MWNQFWWGVTLVVLSFWTGSCWGQSFGDAESNRSEETADDDSGGLSALDATAAESVDPPSRSRWGQWNWRPRAWEWRQPAFLQRMSESTSRSWRSTRRSVGSWMSQTGDAIRESTSDTWETITRATTPARTAQREQESRPRPPSGGRVNEFLSRPRVKF